MKNIWFDVSAIFVLTVILITYYTKYNAPILQNKILVVLVWMNYISTTMDMATGIWDNNAVFASQHFPLWVSGAIQYAYFISRNLTTICYTLYILATLDIGRRSWKHWLAVGIPVGIDLVMIAITPFTDAVFYLDELGRYNRGPLLSVLYIVAVYYLLMAIWLIFYYHNLIPRHRQLAFVLFIIIALVTVGIQGFWPTVLIEGFGTALCILIIYFSIQKPEETLDGDTGFLNKKMFVTKIAVKLRQRAPFSIAVVILEDFSLIEKYYGLTETEKLMKKIATYFKHLSKAVIYRIAEDKFCMVADSEDAAVLSAKLEVVLKRLSQPWELQEYNIVVSALGGMMYCPEDADSAEDIMELINLAEGSRRRNGHLVDMHSLDVTAIKRQRAIETIVKGAVENSLLEVVYQPIYNIDKKSFTAAEALLRLRDPELGDISPAEFIPIAERNGSIIKLGQFVMDSVCRFAAESHIEQYGIEYIEINLSTIELLQDNLVTNVMDCVHKYGLRAEQINLEITESAMDTMPENVNDKLGRLIDGGVTFSLDDYGTGYSNASRMIALPLSIIKLDKSIVQEAFVSPSMKVVLDNTIQMVRLLNKKVLAEGVETAEQAEYLIGQGCDYIQGYYYSRPLRQPNFLELLRASREDGLS